MKILIVGLGSIAKKHIAAIKEINSKAEIFALRYSSDSKEVDGIFSIYGLEEIKNYNFDYFIISNPTSKHLETIKFLQNFDKPLFIEKPLFDNISLKHSFLVDSITKSEVSTYVACNLRFLDCIIKIKEIIIDYRINEVNIYCGSYLPEWRPDSNYRKSYSANKELGGGVHIDLIHELDYLYWLFGEPNKSKSNFRSNSSLEISSIDYANYIWEYSDFCASIILNYYRKDAKRTLEIVCQDCTFLVDLLKNKIYKNGVEIFSSDQTFLDTYKAQMNFFINEIVNKKFKFNTINEAYKILNLCLTD